MVSIKILFGMCDMLNCVRIAHAGKTYAEALPDGTLLKYTWEDTIEAELFRAALDMLAEVKEAWGHQQPFPVDEHIENGERMTAHDVEEIDNWLLYRSRSWYRNYDIKRRRNNA